jgi:hypothetical protein
MWLPTTLIRLYRALRGKVSVLISIFTTQTRLYRAARGKVFSITIMKYSNLILKYFTTHTPPSILNT